MSEQVSKNLPVLRRGTGRNPSDGGCLVQVANWLCDHDLWSDRPVHVHPVLRCVGVAVNDVVDDATRRELALAAVRIAGTTERNPKLDAALEARAVSLFGDSPTCPCSACREAVPGEVLVNRYFALIDAYDELTGHQPRVVPEEEWAELAMAMAAPATEPAPKWAPASCGAYTITCTPSVGIYFKSSNTTTFINCELAS